MSRIVEPLGAGLSRVWDLSEVLADVHTDYQHVVIARTAQGVGLFCDNDRQSTELSQLVYHEALLVPALLLARRLDRILVVGSSEGVVCQLAVAAGARRVDHVDIDADAVRLCAAHLPYGYSPDELARAEAGDGPIRMSYADGWDFLTHTHERYDIVLVDLPDEHPGPAQHNRLYATEYLTRCRAALTDGGVVASQAGCPTLWRNETLRTSWRRFRGTFATTVYFGSDEHEWSFLFGQANPTPDPTAAMIARLPTLPYRPATIDADTLRASTTPPHTLRHPPHIREPSMTGLSATDGKPIVLFLCTHNAGRSQMAMGFFTHLAGDQAVAWSGGSEPDTTVNPAAVEAMAQRGIDISEEHPKPWTDEIVKAADVVITMGCGDACPVYPGRRYEEWELDDPAGLDLDSVRPIRDEIERRVRHLLTELKVTARA